MMEQKLDLFNEYPEGYDMTILQTLYHKPHKDFNTGHYTEPYLTIVAKDNIKGTKIATCIHKPKYQWYLAKEPFDKSHNYEYIEIDKVEPVVCEYSKLEESIAEKTDNLRFYKNNKLNGSYYDNKKLHTLPQVFFSDHNIEDHYRFWFNRKFTNETQIATKGYLDIEVDISKIAGNFPEPGEAPINAITYIYNQQIHTLLLREDINEQSKVFESNCCDESYKQKLYDLIEDTVGGKERLQKFGISNLNVEFYFFDSEIHLIAKLFELINTDKPDFVLAWNMAFDIPYIIERIKVLGFTPASIMCHEDFPIKEAYYYIDERNYNEYAQRGDYAFISCYSVYLDQMIQFASRRKGQKAFTSMKLNDIGEVIAGVKKLDYHHITRNIGELPYLNYEVFVFYNIIDVIVQICIEASTDDIGYIYNSSVLYNTRFPKVHRQTVYLTNKMIDFYFNLGLVFGNNVNKFKEPAKEKYSGAFVADPLLVNDKSKLRVNGIPIMVLDNLVDFDFSSLYPSITREFNLSSPSEIGMIDFGEGDLRNSAFIEDLVTHDYITIGNRWFGLPSYSELYEEAKQILGSDKVETKNDFKIFKDGFLVDYKSEYDETLPEKTYLPEVENAVVFLKKMPKRGEKE